MSRNVKAILIDEKSILRELQDVQARRDDGTVTKTARDLLREYLTQLRLMGDPLAIRPEKSDERRLVKAG